MRYISLKLNPQVLLAAAFLAVAADLFTRPTATAYPAPQTKSDKVLAALEQKLLGHWKGGACDGEITFYANGTYAWEHFGPANQSLSGSWSVQWDALPPTLVLTCTKSDVDDCVGKATKLKLIALDNESLEYKRPSDTPKHTTHHYSREK